MKLKNLQLRENLSGQYVPDDMKYRVVDEIARDNNLFQQNVLAIKYNPLWQQVQVHFSILYGQCNHIYELMILLINSSK